MSRLVTLVHLALGLIATLFSVLALAESIRSARLAAHRRFGLALSALALTAAAHYLVTVWHRSGNGAAAGSQLAALLLTLLPVAVFFWLRVEAYFDGAGDRFIDGKPVWMTVLPSVVACCAGAVLVGAWMNPPVARTADDLAVRWLGVLPSTVLIATFIGIGWSLMRGQQMRQTLLGGWSLSGVAVTLVFPTSAVAYATLVLTERPTLAGSVVDWVGVPAAVWFWVECRRLTGSVELSGHKHTVTVPAERSKRPAPWASGGPG